MRDVLDGRVEEPRSPDWCERRGWTEYLLSIGDDAVTRAESNGLAAILDGTAPPDLAALAGEISAVTVIAPVRDEPKHVVEPLRKASLRKLSQLGALLDAVEPMASRAERIVDVGAGRGHFTNLAAERFDRDTVGIDRAAFARSPGKATFITVDVCKEPLELRSTDLAVGLHACGDVGDRLVIAAAGAGADLALVSCCLQKIAGSARSMLSSESAPPLKRETLGLTNLTSQPRGIETTTERTMRARTMRYALRLLLRERGIDTTPGDEMHGINRRRARLGLRPLAEDALSARSLAPPSDEEIERCEAVAQREHGVIRRLSLPRNMLARLVEIVVVLDRAAALEERGFEVLVRSLFDRAISPRNLAIFAEARA